jgi:hypothetical protein
MKWIYLIVGILVVVLMEYLFVHGMNILKYAEDGYAEKRKGRACMAISVIMAYTVSALFYYYAGGEMELGARIVFWVLFGWMPIIYVSTAVSVPILIYFVIKSIFQAIFGNGDRHHTRRYL